MITKFFLKKYDFKVLAYKSLQVFILFFFTIILFLGLVTYDEFDPSPFSVGDERPNNFLGAFGANFSSILFFIFVALNIIDNMDGNFSLFFLIFISYFVIINFNYFDLSVSS